MQSALTLYDIFRTVKVLQESVKYTVSSEKLSCPTTQLTCKPEKWDSGRDDSISAFINYKSPSARSTAAHKGN